MKRMNFRTIDFKHLGVRMQMATFAANNGSREWHIMLHVTPQDDLFCQQQERLHAAEQEAMSLPELRGAICILKRYFVSDSTNQRPFMYAVDGVATDIIQQQPLDGSKIAAWLYLQSHTHVKKCDGMVVAERNGYRHLWCMGMTSCEGDSEQQTHDLLNAYESILAKQQATLSENCIRTWFFVRDVDTQYAGLVKARRENFLQAGLTPSTHYIASTGIEGKPASQKALVQMGAYAVTGICPQQIQYLYAKTHLNPTYEYGVTFERGTALLFGDRKHIFISGTASIDHRGEVVHTGDIRRQALRMWENVEALLKEANAGFQDVMQMIVYLRDTADYQLVRRMFEERFPETPTVITLAPVCRPAWLIEMECIAVTPETNEEYACF